jgi:hypothetical protein
VEGWGVAQVALVTSKHKTLSSNSNAIKGKEKKERKKFKTVGLELLD